MDKFYKYGWIYWLVFIILFIFIIRAFSIREYRNSEIVSGTVVDEFQKSNRGYRYSINRTYPQYTFIYHDSLHYGGDETFRFNQFGMGGKVKVMFPKGKPDESRIYTFFRFWISHIEFLFIFFAAVFIFFLPAIIYIKTKRSSG